MTTYANRGMSLESYIEYSNVRYRAAGLAIVEKQNTKFIPLWDHKKKQIRSCKVEEKATVPSFAKVVSIEQILENGATLNISQYVSRLEVKDREPKPSFGELMEEWKKNRVELYEGISRILED